MAGTSGARALQPPHGSAPEAPPGPTRRGPNCNQAALRAAWGRGGQNERRVWEGPSDPTAQPPGREANPVGGGART